MLRPRPIRPDDKQALRSGLHRLSDASVYRRFLSPKPNFSAAELRYLTEVDGKDHVAFVIDDPDNECELIAVGRWVRLADEPATAEIAITVADCWQRKGIGTLLARTLAVEARNQGIRRFSATIASENEPALRLLETASEHLELRHGSGVEDAVIDLAA
jgi:RimJ/RimL family protein N-acetyltransferase